MRDNIKLVLFLVYFKSFVRMNLSQKFSFGDSEAKLATVSRYVFWPNATIPFYIVPEHFDQEQSTSIMSTLALFAFKTCLKFVPALAPPTRNQRVLVVANPGGVRKCVLDTAGHPMDEPHFVPALAPPTRNQRVLVVANPGGVRKCVLDTAGHPMDEPHTLIVGYNCLHSPHIDMLLMKALGFPFEHNRASRDLFIDVQFENIDPTGKMALTIGHNIKLYENVFIETNLQSNDYDAVVLLLYPEELSVPIPRHVGSFINASAKVDKHLYKAATVWNCDYVSGGRLVLSPTGHITPYHDVRVVKEAAKKGVLRAMDAGAKKPLIVVPNYVEFPDGQLVAILGALEALYVPLQMRERENMNNFIRIGFHAEEKLTTNFEKVVRNAIALERSRILARDIAGGDPERMAPAKIVEYVKNSFAPCNNITINVIDDEEIIAQEYPLLAAVSRAANRVDRHKARVVEIVYNPSDPSRISETVMLVGKGVTYDTGGADIKISGKMAGMSRDKCGAAAVAGFLKACSILKPTHLKVIGVLCLCRNSVGEDSYVADELLLSKSGKTVRVTNTDAEGRFAMADSVFKLSQLAGKELNPHIYTIATLTGHARACYGDYSASMDNHSAKATNHSTRLQISGSRMGEGIEVSVVRPEDLAVNVGKCRGDDLLQVDMDAKARHHQLAAGFLIKVGGLEDVNVKYTHLDIAGAAGSPPCEPTAVPILSLCHIHKILL